MKISTMEELISAIDSVVSALADDSIIEACRNREHGRCIDQQADWRHPKTGGTLGWLNFDQSKMCEPCAAYWFASSARVLVYGFRRMAKVAPWRYRSD